MQNDTTYTCSQCGKEHKSWPALTFDAPRHYYGLTKKLKENNAFLNTDFCVIRHNDDISRFIRAVLFQNVLDHCADLHYGLWVSLSETSFNDYNDNFNNQNHITEYFGWLCSDIPGYGNTSGIPTTVVTRTGNDRPEIFPHQDHDHPFVKDYYKGISKQEAERRIREMMDEVKKGQQ